MLTGSAPRVAALQAALRGALIAAPATPMDARGHLDPAILGAYARAIGAAVDGVCVWAHTGRGLHLGDAGRARVLAEFRSAVGAGPVIAAVGPPAGTAPEFAAELAATLRLAEAAARGGADGLMVYPVASLREPRTRAARTLALHDAVADAVGLPVLAFLLYEGAGGSDYAPALLTELAARPHLAGVKIAYLDDAIRCQDAIRAVHDGGGLAITGEDRMLGPSLMWGADAVLVGIAAAAPEVTRRVVRAWFDGDAAEFVAAAHRLDRLAAATFVDPMDGYVQRMLWIAQRQGIVPARAARDPFGTVLDETEPQRVLAGYLAASRP